MAQNYDVGTRAWQPDATEGWVASEVVSKNIAGSKVKLVFKLDNGEVTASPITVAAVHAQL
jgi:myosin V